MSSKANNPTRLILFHIMRENFSGAQKKYISFINKPR